MQSTDKKILKFRESPDPSRLRPVREMNRFVVCLSNHVKKKKRLLMCLSSAPAADDTRKYPSCNIQQFSRENQKMFIK